jgi:hypothetical protein
MILGVLLAWSVLAATALLVLIAVGRAGHLEDQRRGYAPPLSVSFRSGSRDTGA